MQVLKVDHVGIAVKNLEESLKFYTEVLGRNWRRSCGRAKLRLLSCLWR